MHTHIFEQGRRECRPKASVAARSRKLKRVLASNLAMSSRCIGCDSGNMRIHQERVLASNPAMSNVCIGINSRNIHTPSSRDISSAGLTKASVAGLVACTGTFASK